MGRFLPHRHPRRLPPADPQREVAHGEEFYDDLPAADGGGAMSRSVTWTR
jgi:hypothetical protein